MAEYQKTTQIGEMTQRFIEFVLLQSQNAAFFLGQAPNPQTGKPEVNLPLAKMFIDQLEMIEEKTRGNLSGEESGIMANALTNLRLAYVEASRKGAPASNPAAAAPAESPPAAPPEPAAPDAAADEKPPDPGDEPKKKFSKSYGA